MGEKAQEGNEIFDSLEGETDARSLADDARYSVAQFYRRFLREVGDRPLRLRRRLLLERAAYELVQTETSVTAIAFGARFGSLEGFSRAFRRAYGVAPSRFRSLGATDCRLQPEEALHYAPLCRPEAPRQGNLSMNMLDRVFGSHHLNMRMILDRCETLTEAQLDAPVEGYYDPLPWMSSAQSIRSLLRHTIGTGSPWPGVEPETRHDPGTLAGLRRILDESYPRFMALLAQHERDGLWDLTFVDAACDPPQVFSYGGWIGHVMLFQTHRRIALLGALERLGRPVDFLDPVDYAGGASPLQ